MKMAFAYNQSLIHSRTSRQTHTDEHIRTSNHKHTQPEGADTDQLWQATLATNGQL